MKRLGFEIRTAALAALRSLTATATLASLALASCVMNDMDGGGWEEGEGVPVTITLDPTVGDLPSVAATRANGATRAYHDDPDDAELAPGQGADGSAAAGHAEDVAVGYLRVMLYRSATGVFVTQYTTPVDAEHTMPLTVDVLTGTYDVVLVTNETSDTERLDDFFATPANYNLISKLSGALVDRSAFAAAREIPMYEVVRGVKITGDNTIVVGGTTQPNPWQPSVTRAGVRLSLEIVLDAGQWEDWTASGNADARKIKISNLPDAARLEAGHTNDSHRSSPAASQSYTASTSAGADGLIAFLDRDGAIDATATTKPAADGKARVRFDRIVLPEVLFEDIDNPAEALELSMNVGREVKAKISAPDPQGAGTATGYTLPRNTWLHLDVTVAPQRLQVTPTVMNWNTAGAPSQIDTKHWIKVSPHPVYISGSAGPHTFLATTNVEEGAITAERRTGGNATPTWMEAVAVDPASIVDNGDGTRTFAVTVTATERSGNVRTGWLDLVAGGVRLMVEVRQYAAMIYAAPGMPGIRKSDYDELLRMREYFDDPGRLDPNIELTIRGSGTYAGTWVDTDIARGPEFAHLGGLEPEPVYTLYFKWGSMVAMVGGKGDAWSADDVVWINPAFAGTITDDGTSVTPASRSGSGTGGRSDIVSAPAAGHGDVCAEITDGEWLIPTGGPFTTTRLYSGTSAPFGTTTSTNVTTWAEARGTHNAAAYWNSDGGTTPDAAGLAPVVAAPLVPTGVAGNGQTVSDDGGLFLPAAGFRKTDEPFVEQGSRANYWTSTAHSASLGHNIAFNASQVIPASAVSYDWDFPVRCVDVGALDVSNDEFVVYANGAQTGLAAFTATTDIAASRGDNSISVSGTGLSLGASSPTVLALAAGGTPGTTEIILDMADGFTSGTVTLHLGGREKTVTVTRRAALPSARSTIAVAGSYGEATLTAGGDWLTLDHNAATGAVSLSVPVNTGTARTGGEAWLSRHNSSQGGGGYTRLRLSQPAPTYALPAGNATVAYPYVGTFHRASQVGERNVRVPVTTNKAWTAWVVSGSFIKLADGFRNGFPWNDTAAESNPVPGDETEIWGKSTSAQLQFRVGMRSQLSSAMPDFTTAPRYGRVRVIYNDYYYYDVYVRQGEAADYLMRREDPSTGAYVNATRPLAKKFLPYNMSDPAKGAGGSAVANHNTVSVADATFNANKLTEYPTQAGYFFQWNRNRAYHPTNSSSTVSTLPYLTYTTWNTAAEICPTGYRHPSAGTAGIRTLTANSSELMQSIFAKTWNQYWETNSTHDDVNGVWGYYADGWFDRRTISNGVGSGAATNSRAGSGATVAYRGVVFFNPNNNASLFFPLAGKRRYETGLLSDSGNLFHYSTSTGFAPAAGQTDAGDKKQWHFRSTYVSGYGSVDWAFSVRCVKN